MSSNDPMRDHRARLEQAAFEAKERRDTNLRDQRSPANTAATRVSLWERLHHVRIPADPQHPVIALVAQDTGLTLDEVHQVQRDRRPPEA